MSLSVGTYNINNYNDHLSLLLNSKFHSRMHLEDGTYVIERIKIIPSSEVQHLQLLLEKIASGEIGIKKEGKYHFNNFQDSEVKHVKKKLDVNGNIQEKDITEKIDEITAENSHEINELIKLINELIAKSFQQANLKNNHGTASSERVSDRNSFKNNADSHSQKSTSIPLTTKSSNRLTEHRKLILSLIQSDILSTVKQTQIRRSMEKRKRVRDEMAQELKFYIIKCYINTQYIINDQLNIKPVHPLRKSH